MSRHISNGKIERRYLHVLLALVLLACLQNAGAAQPEALPADGPQGAIGKYLKERAIKGGVFLHVGGTTSELAESLAGQGQFIAQIVTDSDATVQQVRSALHGKRSYGPITAYRLRGDRLPFADNLARVIVVENALGLAPDELRRVLAPGGLLLERSGESWTSVGKDMPKEMDEWLSIDYDGGRSKSSKDMLAGQPVGLRWLAYSGMWGIEAPEQTVALMLAADGKIVTFRPSQDRRSMWLAAHCAWSGVLLWAYRYPEPAHGRGETIKGRCEGLVADGKVWARGQAVGLDTGEQCFEFKGLPRLGWKNRVLTSGGGAVTAYDTATGRQAWNCPGQDVVGLQVNAFVLATNIEASLEARDILTGKVVWRHDTAPDWKSMGGSTARVEMACTEGHILLTSVPTGSEIGEAYSAKARPASRVVLVYSAVDGSFARAMRFNDARNSLAIWREFCLDRNGIAWCPTDPASVQFCEAGKTWATSSYAQTSITNVHLVGVDVGKGRVSASFQVNRGLVANRCSDWVMSENCAYIGDSTYLNLRDGTYGTGGFYRMGCRIPVMPAYGRLYTPPTDYCKCVRRVHGQSIMAFETRLDVSRKLAEVTDSDCLEKGPAYGQVPPRPDATDETLTLDQALVPPVLETVVDPAAKRVTTVDRRFQLFSAQMQKYARGMTSLERVRGSRPEWLTGYVPAIQSWVAEDGRVIATIPNRHRLFMLPARDKAAAWEFTADARLEPDQSPHLVGGLCLFAAKDGWVYALRASDGALVWRNLAGAAEQRVVAFEQFESTWPVSRNIVVHSGRVYASSGRHGATPDVGWMVACFDLWTGKMVWKQRAPSKDSVPGKYYRSIASGVDQVHLDLSTHSIRSGPCYFDLDTGAVTVGGDKEKSRMDLILRGGIVTKEGAPSADLRLQIDYDGRRWERVWASDPSGGLHYGYVADRVVTNGNQMLLDIVMAISGDAAASGQRLARYRVNVSSARWPYDTWAGDYTGFVGALAVKGSSEAKSSTPAEVKDPLPAAGEHPRLLFRKSDIPRLRQRLEETALGRAFQQHVKDAKDGGVGHAVLYALQGDKAMAAKAKEALFRELDNESDDASNSGQVWPQRILMIAAIWDCCRDAFTDAENARIEATLVRRMEWLLWNPKATDPTRIAGAIASLVFAGDSGDAPPAPKFGPAASDEAAAALADFGRLEKADWEADGKKGFVKRLCLEAGRRYVPVQSGTDAGAKLYGQALYQRLYRQVFGADPSALPEASIYIPRQFAGLVGGVDLRLLTTLWPETAPHLHPGLLQAWNLLAGINDPGRPDQAARLIAGGDPVFAFLSYPLDLKPAAPAAPVWPLAWQGPAGNCLFRNSYRDADGIVAQVFGKRGAFTIWGFGKSWVAADVGRESVVLMPKANTDETTSGAVVHSRLEPEGSGQFTINLDAVYAVKGETNPPVRGARSLAVDYSGLSGAPMLMVVADRIEGGGERLWQWQLPKDAKVEYQDRGFRFKQGDATLQVTLVHPSAVKFMKPEGNPAEHAVRVAGADHFIAVATLGKGEPPAVTSSGAGLGAVIQVGVRTFRLRTDRAERLEPGEQRGRIEPPRAAPIKVTGEWSSHLGPAGGFADASTNQVKLLGSVSQAKLMWESEAYDLGFGAADEDAMTNGYARGTQLPFAGAASPIVTGGLVIVSYSKPSGPAWDDDARARLEPQFWNFARIAADDTVTAIDAATGRTRWTTPMSYQGNNYPAGSRGVWNVTPCSAGGRVFAFGTSGRVYAFEPVRGGLLWESNIGPVHENLEAAKREAVVSGRMAQPPARPYGMLIVVDGVLLAPDWNDGLVAFDAPSGTILWRSEKGLALTSGYNSPTPVKVNGKDYVACVNLDGALRLLDAGTGKVLWTHALGSYHATQPVFGKETLLVFEKHPDCRHAADTATVKRKGALAAYRLSETGAQRLWQLDGAKSGVDLSPESAPLRKIATHADGTVYCAGQDKLAIVSEVDGKVLGEVADAGRIDRFHLWGDRLFLLSDPGKDAPPTWRAYDLSAGKPAALGVETLSTRHRNVRGDEVPAYEVFTDGFMFVRQWREGWGGVCCYDLRAPAKGEEGRTAPKSKDQGGINTAR